MFFGVSTLQTFHVLVSLVAIGTGVIVLYGLMSSQKMSLLTFIFLVTTLATTLTGFLFPLNGFTPAVSVGIISIFVLIAVFYARYGRRMTGRWRGVYVVTAVLSLYFNVFVLVAQMFQKVPALKALAPNGSEPPFLAVQAMLLLLFLVAGYRAYRLFRPDRPAAAAARTA
ncbi:hypothetical protein ASD64_00935 [Mesorhizobium sp. Root157]|uniref:hypothetical protein n=1 Tax=Mesorhizobium sp. Root157 TaxID=1736477 RepID=UPI0006FA1F05|nr:hypothetical protein [Mesorhizobium sp. Root157]KRA00471.1 hypothetical protein ASD64_00935 [Mesorhizobium sp. Root157]